MKGDHHLLALTTKTITAEDDPTLGEGEVRVEPLFSLPIQVCKATESADVKLDAAAPSGAPYKVQYVDTATGEVFDYADRLQGVRVGDTFRSIDSDALKEIEERTKQKTMIVEGVADLDSIDFSRAEGMYFLQSPANGSAKAYRLIYEALRPAKKKGDRPAQKARALITKRTARSRQQLAVIYSDERLGCLVYVKMRFAHDLRQPDDAVLAPREAVVADDQLEMARKVVARLPDGLEALDAEKDDAIDLRRELVEAALEGVEMPAPTTKVADAKKEDDLESLLAASLEAAAA